MLTDTYNLLLLKGYGKQFLHRSETGGLLAGDSMNIIKGNIFAVMLLVIGIALLNQGFATKNNISVYAGTSATLFALIIGFIANRRIIAKVLEKKPQAEEPVRRTASKRLRAVKAKPDVDEPFVHESKEVNLLEKWHNLRAGQKIVIKSAILTIILGLISHAPHEFGHGLVCWESGHNFAMEYGLAGGSGYCDGAPSSLMEYYFMGGGFAGIVFLLAGVLTKKVSLALHTALLSVGLSQFAVAFIETFAHGVYIANSLPVNFGIQAIGLMCWLGVCYVRIISPYRKEIGELTKSQ
jgi:hypothetical protein